MAAVVVAVVVYGYGSVVVYGHGLVVVYGYGFGAVVVDGRGDDDGAATVSRLSMRWWISLWWKSTLTIRLRTCEDVAP